MLAFLTLLVGLVLPMWGLFVLVRRGKRQLDTATAYRQAAAELGLAVDTRGVSVQGHLGDQRLWVGEVMVGHGTDRRTAIWGVLDLCRPLGLGMQVRRRGLSERVFRRGRAPGVELGDTFDRRVEIHGDNAPRIRALLGNPTVKQRLSGLMDRWPDMVLTDSSVRVHLRAHETREQDLMELIEQLRATARDLSEARSAVGPPEQLEELVRTWAMLASDLGLSLEPWLPALAGELNGRPIVVVIHRADRGYQAEVRLTLAPHKALGLRVRTQTAPDGYWSVGQDIQFGEQAFDDAFVVKGWDPEKVRDTLGPEARAGLLELQRMGTLHLDDHLLVIKQIHTDAEAVRTAIQCAEHAANVVGW